MGTTDPFEDDNFMETAEHDATPEVELAEYVTDIDNDDSKLGRTSKCSHQEWEVHLQRCGGTLNHCYSAEEFTEGLMCLANHELT